MRFRTQGSTHFAPGLTSSKGYNGLVSSYSPPVAPQPKISVGGSIVGVMKEMSDVATAGYYSLVKEGANLPVNPCSSTDVNIPNGVSDSIHSIDCIRNYSAWGKDRIEHVIHVYQGPLVSIDPRSYPVPTSPCVSSGVLFTEAYAAAKSEVWDSLTFAAELGKTTSMITGLLGRVITHVRNIKKAMRDRDPGAIGKTFSEIWLEGRYGWRPTIYDLETIQDTLKSLGQDKIRIRKSKTSTGQSNSYGSWTTIGPLKVRPVMQHYYENKAGVSVIGDFSVPISFDPLVTAWELIPFSFVLDWFVNIGSIIQTLSPFANGVLESGWESTKVTTTLTLEYQENEVYRDQYNYTISALPSGGGTSVCTTYTRQPSQGAVSFGLNISLDKFKVLDLAALYIALSEPERGRRTRKNVKI